VGGHDRYCGEPDLPACEACVADNGHFLREEIAVAALRRRSAGFLTAARRVVVPSDDTGVRMRRHFDGLTTITVPHEDDAAIPAVSDRRAAAAYFGPPGVGSPGVGRSGVGPSGNGPSGNDMTNAAGRSRISVCVVGGIGVHKGYDILLACARDAARRDLDLEFIVVGHTTDDARMLATGDMVSQPGRYLAGGLAGGSIRYRRPSRANPEHGARNSASIGSVRQCY
jgi:hypothetical protein